MWKRKRTGRQSTDGEMGKRDYKRSEKRGDLTAE